MNSISHSFIGHKGRCFDVRFSHSNSMILTASEDGTAKLWNAESRKTIFTFTHDLSSEVLRCAFLSSDDVVCTCGSDGKVIVWKRDESTDSMSFSQEQIIPHQDQIYACVTAGCITSPHLITASDNLLHLWDLSHSPEDNSYSVSFQALSEFDISQSFGGPRNPENKAFIFDVQPAVSRTPAQSHEGNPFATTLALALSDGTIRLLDLREPSEAHAFLVSQNIAGRGHSHITGVNWSPDWSSLIASTGFGDLILFDLRMCTKRAYIHSAHSSSCFGSCFFNNSSHRMDCASWAADGTIRLWDIDTIQGDCSQSNCTREILLPNYPIYCATPYPSESSKELVIGGGSSQQSFMGNLIHSVKIFE